MLLVVIAILAGCVKARNTVTPEGSAMQNPTESTSSGTTERRDAASDSANGVDSSGGPAIFQSEIFSMSYVGHEKACIIPDGEPILWMPDDRAPIASPIEVVTLAKIDLACEGDTGTWFFVNIPVYDSPTNHYGWIRAGSTQALSEDLFPSIASGIVMKKGTAGAYDDGTAVVLDQDRTGMIEKREDARVRILFGGGEVIWFDAADVTYEALTGDSGGAEDVGISSDSGGEVMNNCAWTISVTDADTNEPIAGARIIVTELDQSWPILQDAPTLVALPVPRPAHSAAHAFTDAYTTIVTADGYLPRIDHDLCPLSPADAMLSFELQKQEPMSNQACTEFFHSPSQAEMAEVLSHFGIE